MGGECNCIGGDFGEYVKDSLGLLPLLSLRIVVVVVEEVSSSTCVF